MVCLFIIGLTALCTERLYDNLVHCTLGFPVGVRLKPFPTKCPAHTHNPIQPQTPRQVPDNGVVPV
jgi:hypothetical protein